ncbi:MAG: hypothetical protein IPN94_26595 [Sphingobacteriales bacterium]|nr:hypothetical protein [Sphingobacteriales bacterium]
MKSTTYIRTLQIIHVAIMLGIVGFWLVIVLAIQPPMQPDMPNIVIYALTGMGFVACLAGSIFAFNLQNKAKAESQLSNKLQQYRTAHIIFLGAMEGAAMLFLIAYMLSAYWWTQFFGAILAIMAIYFPTRTRIISALELSNSDVDKWDNLA